MTGARSGDGGRRLRSGVGRPRARAISIVTSSFVRLSRGAALKQVFVDSIKAILKEIGSTVFQRGLTRDWTFGLTLPCCFSVYVKSIARSWTRTMPSCPRGRARDASFAHIRRRRSILRGAGYDRSYGSSYTLGDSVSEAISLRVKDPLRDCVRERG